MAEQAVHIEGPKRRKMRAAMRNTLAIMFGVTAPRRMRFTETAGRRLDLRRFLRVVPDSAIQVPAIQVPAIQVPAIQVPAIQVATPIAHSDLAPVSVPVAAAPSLDGLEDSLSLDSMAEPVRAAALAIEVLAPASARASAFGVPVRVSVPDARIAAIMRAALAETQKTRVTDRLVEVVVAPAATKPRRAAVSQG